MLSSLTPVGEGSRSQRWSVTVTAFTLGSVLGGAGTGLLAGVLGHLVAPAPRTALVVVGILAAAALVGDLVGRTPPSLERQVDRTWMTRFRGWVYGLGYGLQLGCGLATYISSWATWLLVATMVLAGDVRVAVSIGALHGLVRSGTLWTTARLHSAQRIRTHHQVLQRMHPAVSTTSNVLLAGLAALAVVVLAGS